MKKLGCTVGDRDIIELKLLGHGYDGENKLSDYRLVGVQIEI